MRKLKKAYQIDLCRRLASRDQAVHEQANAEVAQIWREVLTDMHRRDTPEQRRADGVSENYLNP